VLSVVDGEEPEAVEVARPERSVADLHGCEHAGSEAYGNAMDPARKPAPSGWAGAIQS
jgi:hypothetical protein